MSDFVTQRTVEFSDTDAGGVVHFGRYLVFAETAEHEFLRSLGTEVFDPAEGTVSWPRVSATIDYRAPARFGELLDIHVDVLRKGARSMTYGFRILRGDTLLAEGSMTAACCVLDGESGPRSVDIPDEFAALIDGVVEAREEE